MRDECMNERHVELHYVLGHTIIFLHDHHARHGQRLEYTQEIIGS